MWGNEKYIKERMSEITSFFFIFIEISSCWRQQLLPMGTLNHSPFNVRAVWRQISKEDFFLLDFF